MSANHTEALSQAVIESDLSKLSAADRLFYYNKVCESLCLNPLTKPFQYLKLKQDGVEKIILYATKDCTEQLRKNNGISIQIVAREVAGSLYTVVARATDKFGRSDESTGVVNFMVGRYNRDTKARYYVQAEGEEKANLLMKAETKAKRRVTLSICGLGFLDETEVDSIRGAKVIKEEEIDEVAKQVEVQQVDSQRLELIEEVKRIIIDQNVEQSIIDQWLERGKVSHIDDLPLNLLSKIILTANKKLLEERVLNES